MEKDALLRNALALQRNAALDALAVATAENQALRQRVAELEGAAGNKESQQQT
jgi:hypothetical protein